MIRENIGRRWREITLPSTLRFIRQNNFSDCKNLERISFPEGLLEIGQRAFKGCSALKRIDLPESLQKISGLAFNGCRKLEDMAISVGVTESDTGHLNIADCVPLFCRRISRFCRSVSFVDA